MDNVKREESIMDDETYEMCAETLQKTDYGELGIEYQASLEQFQQVLQSSIESRFHNFQIPLSQLSNLRLKTNQLRPINYELPSHLPKNLSTDTEPVSVPTDLLQNLCHTDLLPQNIDIIQALHGNEYARNITAANEMPLNRDIQQELGSELDLSLLNRQNLESDVLSNDPMENPTIDNHLYEHQMALQKMEQNIGLRIDQPLDQLNQRISQALAQRLEHNLPQRFDQSISRLDHSLSQRLDQTMVPRLDQSLDQRSVAYRLDQYLTPRVYSSGTGHEQKLEQMEQIPVTSQIKAEQEEDGYYYDGMNQPLSADINGQVPQPTVNGPPANINSNQLYSIYNNQIPLPALHPIDFYSRQQAYFQSYIANGVRENPQNLVVQRLYDNHGHYNDEYKKQRQDVDIKKDFKIEEPKENQKPPNLNKMYYENNLNDQEKNNITGANNEMADNLIINIKGEYTCYKCNETLPSKRLLKQHTKTCQSGDNADLEKFGKFSCSRCTYKCQSPAILKIHERTHTGEKPFACSECDYKSGQKNNVQKHMLVHTKRKPFKCQYCNYRCIQKNNLVVHERTHTGDKPFACKYCTYRTVQKPNLVKHMYLHTDQKPFSCDQCNYRCVQKTNLTKHKLRHINEQEGEKVDTKNVKPYKPRQKTVKCLHCTFKCVQKSSLEKHMAYKHSDLSVSEVSESVDLCIKRPDNETDNLLQCLPLQV